MPTQERSSLQSDGGNGYIWCRENGRRYAFSPSGRLDAITDEVGNRLELTYDTANRLSSVLDTASNRSIWFDYDGAGYLNRIHGPSTAAVPDGIRTSFDHDANGNLIEVTYADGSGFTYSYDDPQDVHNLTEIRTLAGHLVRSYSYDSLDRCTGMTSPDGDGFTLMYVSSTQIDVTDAYGVLRTHTLREVAARKRLLSISGLPDPPYAHSPFNWWWYDENLNLTQIHDWAGKVTVFADFDSRGNPATVREAYGTPSERTIRYTYHPGRSVLLSRTEASVLSGGGVKETIHDHDSDYDSFPNENPAALPTRIIERGYTKDLNDSTIAFEYVTTLAYNDKGQVLTIDGPRSGGADTLSFSYDSQTGDLLSVTRPGSLTTSYTDYDPAGFPGEITDANNQSRTLAYDGRGRLTSISFAGTTKTISYTSSGRVGSRSDLDGVTTTYGYDPQFGRLTTIEDHVGNRISYGYDSQGNKISESRYDQAGTRAFHREWNYSSPQVPGKLWREIYADQTFSELSYESGTGRLLSRQDAEGHTTSYSYDIFGKVAAITRPMSTRTDYGYDAQGHVSCVTDPRGHSTTYTVDDMGRVVEESSPDRGIIRYAYNESGDLAGKRDAAQATTTYAYDPSGRLTAVQFPDPSEDISFSYDEGVNGKGHRTGMIDPSGATSYSYDASGRVSAVEATIWSGTSYHTFWTQYDYTPEGRPSRLTYPDGRVVDYVRASCLCQVSRVTTTSPSGATDILQDNLSYLPFGGAKAMSMGAGAVSNQFDENGHLTAANPGARRERRYTYNASGSLTSIVAPNSPWQDRTYGYDPLGQLQHASGSFGSVDFTYDEAGNRIAQTREGESQEMAGISNRSFTYSQSNQLLSVEEEGVALGSYTYNGLSQRVRKDAGGHTTLFLYDIEGNLILEALPDGTIAKEYIYNGGSRLARVDAGNGTIHFYRNDSLGTPQLMTDTANMVVWEARYKPFGEAEIYPMSSVVNNFRFQGQYYDEETGYHYNWHRYYDPKTGRYLSPDPIGLAGGINPYLYVEGDPINAVDPLGLAKCQYSISAHILVCWQNDPGFIGPPISLGPNGVFSGMGECRDSPPCSDDKNRGPIPPGKYNMNPDNRPGHERYWRLEPNPRVPGWKYYLGLARSGFELHPGSVSLGCITTDKNNPFAMDQYGQVHNLLQSESGSNTLEVVP